MAPSSNLIPNRRGERRGGRRKGVPNKVTTALREAILEAAESRWRRRGHSGLSDQACD